MYEYYFVFLVLILIVSLIAGKASSNVNKTFNTYQNMPVRSHMTGVDVAKKLLKSNDISDVRVEKVKGSLTDHYHPTKKQVNLSQTVYGNNSVAAVAVAAHEVGHVVQRKKGYLPYKLRAFLVPITNLGSRLALPLVLVGLLLDFSVGFTQEYTVGYTLALLGVALYGLSTLFALVTLPVEFNASRRAKRMLLEEGIMTAEELPYAEKMLSAAAQTYVASLMVSLVYFLRFLVWVLALFGNRNRRR